MSIFVSDNVKDIKKLYGFNKPVEIKSIQKKGKKIKLGVSFSFLGDIKESNEYIKILCRPRHWGQALEFSVKLVKQEKNNGYHEITSTIDVDRLIAEGSFETRFVDFYLKLIETDGEEKLLKIGDEEKNLNIFSGEDIIVFEKAFKNVDVYAYLTRSQKRFLSLMYRDRKPVDTRINRIKESLAYALNNLLGSVNKEKWVFFEFEAKTAQDNAFVFFKWMSANKPEVDCYYIIDKKSQDYEKLKGFKGVVSYFSFKHLLLLLRCSLVVTSQSRYHGFKMRPLSSKFKEKYIKKNCIFLQHGVTSFKKTNAYNKVNFREMADLTTVVSEKEKRIVTKNWQLKDNQAAVTGFARFDELVDKSFENEVPEILIMPTWRLWLEGIEKKGFIESEFFIFYNQLLQKLSKDKKVVDKKVKITFYLHSKIAENIRSFDCVDNISIVELGECPVNHMLMRSNILVTDYSSVAWDFKYMNKPVIFSHFDVKNFLKVHGSYIDFEKDLFGSRVFTTDQLISTIHKILSEGDIYENNEKYFDNVDRKNCSRIYDSIVEKFGLIS